MEWYYCGVCLLIVWDVWRPPWVLGQMALQSALMSWCSIFSVFMLRWITCGFGISVSLPATACKSWKRKFLQFSSEMSGPFDDLNQWCSCHHRSGKSIAITGCTTGLGYYLALAAARKGASKATLPFSLCVFLQPWACGFIMLLHVGSSSKSMLSILCRLLMMVVISFEMRDFCE